MRKQTHHGFAIVRVDKWSNVLVEPTNLITVKKIVGDRETAMAEVERLNDLNQEKGCIYFWQTTRLEL